jgi:hypothetical protein
MNFKARIFKQVQILNDGKPLQAIDDFFSNEIVMYDNDTVFAQGKIQSRSKQEPFINGAKSISGNITDLLVDELNEVAIFRNQSKFTNADDQEFQIDGLCWQQWKDGHVIVERYYSGELMLTKISEFYKN